MNIFKVALITLSSVAASFAAPSWTSPAYVQQIWVSPGPTPVAHITVSGLSPFVFHVNPVGNKELLDIARDAMANNLRVKIYGDQALVPTLTTGLSSPNVVNATGYPLYSIAIVP